MKLGASLGLSLAALAWSSLCPAQAAGGICTLNAFVASGTYGFAAQGLATGANPFVPAGPFTQAGTVTQVVKQEDASTLSGTWSASLAQNDAGGYMPNVTFGGAFQVSKATCAGDFYVTTPVQIAQPSFHVIFVGNGDEIRTIALIPNLLVSYSTAKKL